MQPRAYERRSGVADHLAGAGLVLALLAVAAGGHAAAMALGGCLLTVAVGVQQGRRGAAAGSDPAGVAASPRRAGAPAAAAGYRPVGQPHATEGPAGAGVAVRWWRRDGQDRLYVTDAAGRSLGWLDRVTGAVHVLDEGDRAAVACALSARCGRAATTART